MAKKIDENLPFEILMEKARHEMAMAINTIGRNYNIPSAILSSMVTQIATESKLNALETIVANYDISIPEALTGAVQQQTETPAE